MMLTNSISGLFQEAVEKLGADYIQYSKWLVESFRLSNYQTKGLAPLHQHCCRVPAGSEGPGKVSTGAAAQPSTKGPTGDTGDGLCTAEYCESNVLSANAYTEVEHEVSRTHAGTYSRVWQDRVRQMLLKSSEAVLSIQSGLCCRSRLRRFCGLLFDIFSAVKWCNCLNSSWPLPLFSQSNRPTVLCILCRARVVFK